MSGIFMDPAQLCPGCWVGKFGDNVQGRVGLWVSSSGVRTRRNGKGLCAAGHPWGWMEWDSVPVLVAGGTPGLAALLSPSKIFSFPGDSDLQTPHPLMRNSFSPADDPNPTLQLFERVGVLFRTGKSHLSCFSLILPVPRVDPCRRKLKFVPSLRGTALGSQCPRRGCDPWLTHCPAETLGPRHIPKGIPQNWTALFISGFCCTKPAQQGRNLQRAWGENFCKLDTPPQWRGEFSHRKI